MFISKGCIFYNFFAIFGSSKLGNKVFKIQGTTEFGQGTVLFNL